MGGACRLESARCTAVACIFTSHGDDKVHRFIVEGRQAFNLGLWNVRAGTGLLRSSTEESSYRKRKGVFGGTM